MSFSFCAAPLKISAACDDLWGGPPGPRPTPPSARFWLRLCCSVAHALLRAASALVPMPGLPVGEGYGETSGGSSNNISPLKCSWHQYTPPVSDRIRSEERRVGK